MATSTIADVQSAVTTQSGGAVAATYHQIRSAARNGLIPAIAPRGVNRIRFRPDQVESAANVMIGLLGGAV